MNRREEIREKALKDLQQYAVLMINGHFDFGNGYHGRVYLNPHQLFRYPSTIWRFAQDLIDVLPPSIVEQTEVVASPVGAPFAHTMAGLPTTAATCRDRHASSPSADLSAATLSRLPAAGEGAEHADRRRRMNTVDVRALRRLAGGGR
jgi:hypothetical protein